VAQQTLQKTFTVALVGNPNTGKSTLFSALAGVRQRVGNYPGVTVEKKTGHTTIAGRRFELVDLPGTYSLAPRSLDEMVAVDVLLGRLKDVAPPDAVLSILDASNLERNLYLLNQLLEMGLPVVVALNMGDVARERGVEIDVPLLAKRLGVPVVEVQANKCSGLEVLKQALLAAAESSVLNSEVEKRESPFSTDFQSEVAQLQQHVGTALGRETPRYLVERLLLDVGGYVERALLDGQAAKIRPQIEASRQRLAALGQPVPAVEAMARYGWVHTLLEGVVRRPSERPATMSDKIDRILTHKLWGTLLFAALMLLVFSSIFSFAAPLMGWVEEAIAWLGSLITGTETRAAFIAPGPLQSLLVDGVIAGVGAVVIFLPQILILFAFIAVLEDCGYMARAAYLMDKLMVKAGLSGKSFIPMLSSFACAVPGIMATRVIENRRDRLTTILVAPLMSCSARLPVYVILISAFVPARKYLGGLLGLQGLTMLAMYSVGIVTAVIVAYTLKRTVLKGETPPFVMELPSYKLPALRTVLWRMGERGWAFLAQAGTLIFAVSIIIWAAAYYPRNEELVERELASEQQSLALQLETLGADDPERAVVRDELEQFGSEAGRENMAAGIRQKNSYLGQAGQLIEPAVRPLGWDWRIGCAVIASFPAREVVMSVLGVIYNLGSDPDYDDEEVTANLERRLQVARWDGTDRKVFNLPVALSIMVFFALCAQCVATLAAIRRETNSWGWPVFSFVYMTVLAYLGALATYQVGMLFVS
jgi:ferrous iron transport protein B